jgi:hypothetical protein
MVETRSVVRRRLEKEQEEQRESNARNLLRPWLSLNREGLLSWDEYKKLSSLNKFCWNQLVVFIQVQSFNYEEGMDLFCDLGRDHLKTRILNQARFLTPRRPRLSLRALQGLAFTASNLLCLDLYNTHVWMVSDLEQVLPSLTNLAVLYLGGVQFDGLRELEPKHLDVSGLKKLETVSLSPNVTHLVVTGVNHSIISLDTGSFDLPHIVRLSVPNVQILSCPVFSVQHLRKVELTKLKFLLISCRSARGYLRLKQGYEKWFTCEVVGAYPNSESLQRVRELRQNGIQCRFPDFHLLGRYHGQPLATGMRLLGEDWPPLLSSSLSTRTHIV